MSPNSLPRRRLLAATAAGLTTAVAGCSSLPGTDDSTPEDLQFDELHQTPTYVADGVDLSLPDEVPTVSGRNNADLLLLPGDTGVDAEQAAEWLAADRAIGLLGDDAEPTWLDWETSDAFKQTFENEGVADSDPDPDLLVGVTFENRTSTYGRTWADGPRERDLIRALDEIVADIEAHTPT
ncbi:MULTISPECIES: hypothetical protein [Halolamina]|uniref:Uncharacterized protein n=1 Tax=Halolamina pelagica TaxID=699431 RepID=A0A1I5TDR6_9EURY|nr:MULTISPECIES: hypothetical protein [Halolamina]NHX37264.1 hypothetical protein [Halolamina sp. R1-12]SFP80576.1 hypothetical protein SAMN05216277_1092 [Halolamina pelagica]